MSDRSPSIIPTSGRKLKCGQLMATPSGPGMQIQPSDSHPVTEGDKHLLQSYECLGHLQATPGITGVHGRLCKSVSGSFYSGVPKRSILIGKMAVLQFKEHVRCPHPSYRIRPAGQKKPSPGCCLSGGIAPGCAGRVLRWRGAPADGTCTPSSLRWTEPDQQVHRYHRILTKWTEGQISIFWIHVPFGRLYIYLVASPQLSAASHMKRSLHGAQRRE